MYVGRYIHIYIYIRACVCIYQILGTCLSQSKTESDHNKNNKNNKNNTTTDKTYYTFLSVETAAVRAFASGSGYSKPSIALY